MQKVYLVSYWIPVLQEKVGAYFDGPNIFKATEKQI